MKEKVVFDTNKMRNTDINNFLGNRVDLEKFTLVADIVIPEAVIQETIRQKRTKLKSNQDKFVVNPFHQLVGLKEENTKSFKIDEYIDNLRTTETIPFEVIDLKDFQVLEEIKDLAYKKLAPFEGGDNTDKGFKDAIIYFSVLEHLQEIPNKKIFVCTDDIRLAEAFNRHHNIVVIKTFDEFKQESISQFTDDYFLEKLNNELTPDVSETNIKEFWYGINDNKILLVNVDDEDYVVEIDSGEILSSKLRSKYAGNITRLINSNSFRNTHSRIAEISSFINYFSDEEIEAILNASIENEEIRRIMDDTDVKEFIGELFDAKKELLPKENRSQLSELLE